MNLSHRLSTVVLRLAVPVKNVRHDRFSVGDTW